MASIVNYAVEQTTIKDERTIADNEIVDKIKLKTSERVTWTQLRRMAPVPKWNDSHPYEPGFFLDVIRPNHVSRLVWELDAEYTIIKGGQIDANPLSRAAVITGKSSLIEQPTFLDWQGKPIVTRAGEFIPGVMQMIPTLEYTVTKNLGSDPGWLMTHIGAINSDPVRLRGLTWPAKTLMLGAVSFGEFKVEEKARYSEYTITLMGDPRKWTHELWNVGTVELYQADVHINGHFRTIWRQRPIMAGTPSVPVESPVPLTDEGQAIVDYLDSGSGEPMKTGTLRKLYYDTQKILAFNGTLPLV